MYNFLYHCVFCLAFINFLIYWINLFFSGTKEKWASSHHKYQNLNEQGSSPSSILYEHQNTLPAQSKISWRQWPATFFQNLNNLTFSLPGQIFDFKTSFITCSLLWFVLTSLILFRIIQSNHFPLSNFYEALIFLTWCLVTLNFVILLESNGARELLKVFSNNPLVSTFAQNTFNFHGKSMLTSMQSMEARSVQKQVSGAILAPCILFIIAFAQFNLSSDVTPLVPALKSNWLLMHVSIMICSYTTFMVGGLISIILLMQTFFSQNPIKGWNFWQYFLKPLSKEQNRGVSPASKDFAARASMFFTEVSRRLRLKLGKNSSSGGEWNPRPILTPKAEIPFKKAKSSKQASNTGRENFSIPPVLLKSGVSGFSTDHLYMQPNIDRGQSRNPAYPSIRGVLPDNVARKQNQYPALEKKWSLSPLSSGFPSFEHIRQGPYKMQKKNFYIILDNLSYRMMGIGFPLFTLGILSGAVWANEAWGSYWSWDIKEVGSFINWLLVALYFHCRYKNFISLSHIVAFISLVVLFFNFFGISLGIFGSSLHAYGASS